MKDELRARVRLSAGTRRRVGACHAIAVRAGLRPGAVIAQLAGHVGTSEDGGVMVASFTPPVVGSGLALGGLEAPDPPERQACTTTHNP